MFNIVTIVITDILHRKRIVLGDICGVQNAVTRLLANGTSTIVGFLATYEGEPTLDSLYVITFFIHPALCNTLGNGAEQGNPGFRKMVYEGRLRHHESEIRFCMKIWRPSGSLFGTNGQLYFVGCVILLVWFFAGVVMGINMSEQSTPSFIRWWYYDVPWILLTVIAWIPTV